jgi:WD40 repeat protein
MPPPPPDRTHLVTASKDGSTRLWRSDGAGRPTVWSGEYGPVLALAFHPRGKQVAVAYEADTAQV